MLVKTTYFAKVALNTIKVYNMKYKVLAILLLVGVIMTTIVSVADIKIDTPARCVPHLNLTEYIVREYKNGVTEDEMLDLADKTSLRKGIDKNTISTVRDIITLIYFIQPTTDEEFKTVYTSVIHLCLANHAHKSDNSPLI